MHRAGAVALAALAGCSGGRAATVEAPVKPEPVASPAFRFDWSPPCEVPVISTGRQGKQAVDVTSAYQVVATPDADRVQISFAAAQLLRIDGRPLTAAQHEAASRC